ncbi:MAG: DUF3124 domain-containing protein [Cytophagales bacterium]|nr:MAG: DUF3124 domain-containing protein [Cytophagales bacterium]
MTKMIIVKKVILVIVTTFLLCQCENIEKNFQNNNTAKEKNIINAIETEVTTKKTKPFAIQLKNCNFGQIVYAPVYSELYPYIHKTKMLLPATLVIHNIDLEKILYITKIEYYDNNGNILRCAKAKNIQLNPLSSINCVIEQQDIQSGVGSNFLIEWQGNREMSKPIIETIMLGSDVGQGFSFVSSGKIVKEKEF